MPRGGNILPLGTKVSENRKGSVHYRSQIHKQISAIGSGLAVGAVEFLAFRHIWGAIAAACTVTGILEFVFWIQTRMKS